LQSLPGTAMKPKGVLSLDDTLLTHYGQHFDKIAYLSAIPAVHLRVLCDYGIRQRSQHFDHPFMALAETSAIR